LVAGAPGNGDNRSVTGKTERGERQVNRLDRHGIGKRLRDRLRRGAACCALAFACIATTAAQDAPALPEQPPEPRPVEQFSAVERAAVSIDGVRLFYVRGNTAYPATERAANIAARIRALAADRSFRVESLRIAEETSKSTLLAGDRLVMSVIDADAAMEGFRRQILADLYRQRVAQAITAWRNDRSPEVLATRTLYAAAATAVLIALLFALRRAHRWLHAAATRGMGGHLQQLPGRAFHLFNRRQLWHALHASLRVLRLLLGVVIAFAYLDFVLELYPWTRPLARSLFDLVIDPLRTLGSTFAGDIPDLITLLLIFLLTRYVLKLTRMFFSGAESGRITVTGLDGELVWPTYRIVRLFVIVFALVAAYPYIPGSGTDAFKGISLFLGLVFSLGSTTVIGNIIAGYTMIYRRAFRIGDRIQVGDVVGDVIERRLLGTRVRSLKNEEVVLPNTHLLNSNIVNYSALAKSEGLILHTTVGIGYETPWRQVEAMLHEAAARTEGVLREPAPFVLQQSLGDFCVVYELNVYSADAHGMMRARTALHRNILDVFNEYGVQIMTPAYEVDTPEPKLVPRERWFEPPAQPPAAP
jgi:small-conductance mechanosensitive channel